MRSLDFILVSNSKSICVSLHLEVESNALKWMAIQGNLVLFNENRLRVNHDSFPNYFFLTHLINLHGCQILQIFGDDFVNLYRELKWNLEKCLKVLQKQHYLYLLVLKLIQMLTFTLRSPVPSRIKFKVS